MSSIPSLLNTARPVYRSLRVIVLAIVTGRPWWGAKGERLDEELTWKVRHEAAGHGSRQKAPPKAYFYWKRGGQLVRSAEFTQSELEVGVERLSAAGEDPTQFVLALKKLALSRGS
jgi:hypothetical protein